jgi:tryptophanyl-tRNA synthetase
MTEEPKLQNETFEAALARSNDLEDKLKLTPEKFRVLTGDRPTGRLHIGHLFGSLLNRVRLQNMGVPIFIVIADYQVLTDRETFESIAENVLGLTIDYLASGLDPEKKQTVIFPHSHVPELNQLLIPFLTLVTNAELDRNPTVKEEIEASGQSRINAGMYTYPVHQAADILFCKANIVPVGKDQLPHLEVTRTIARRFNARYAKKASIFPEPGALLSKAPVILGLDGNAKMSKSRNNAISLSASKEETLSLISRAKTDAERHITYDPANRPEVANLLLLASLCTNRNPEDIAVEIGSGGASKLKAFLSESLNEYLAPLRKRRAELEDNLDYIRDVLRRGIVRAREVASDTLSEVRRSMNMEI